MEGGKTESQDYLTISIYLPISVTTLSTSPHYLTTSLTCYYLTTSLAHY